MANLLACAIVLQLLPQENEFAEPFARHLHEAQKSYNWHDGCHHYYTTSNSSKATDSSMSSTWPPGIIITPNVHSLSQWRGRPDEATRMWDTLQNENACCGVRERTEWEKFSPDNESYPSSCCPPEARMHQTGYVLCRYQASYRTDPCLPTVYLPVVSMAYQLGVAIWANLFVALAAILLRLLHLMLPHCRAANRRQTTSDPRPGDQGATGGLIVALDRLDHTGQPVQRREAAAGGSGGGVVHVDGDTDNRSNYAQMYQLQPSVPQHIERIHLASYGTLQC